MKAFMEKTSGLAIVDFLDAGNWDIITKYEVDYKLGLVYINWHDYRGQDEPEDEKIVRSMVFPADVYGLCFQFQELRVINFRDITFFTFRGYAVSTKEVEKIMSTGADQFKILEDKNNFAVEIVRKVKQEIHNFHFLNTPIFSTLILLKRIGLSASQSKGLLFAYNLWHSEQRVNAVTSELKTKTLDAESICEKANTLRRIMESILKIECCYRSRQIQVKKSYGELLLGDLIKLVKDFRSESERTDLNSIVRISNELSHDSGKPITPEKALQLADLVKGYCEKLDLEIHTNPDPHFSF